MDIDVSGCGVMLRRVAVGDGVTDDELRRAVRDGWLRRIRRGAYVSAAEVDRCDDAGRHYLTVRAALGQLGNGTVISHQSAAVLHGIELWQPDLRRVHASIRKSSGGRLGRQLHLHALPFEDDEIEWVDGMPLFSPARTIVDLARTLPFEQAVVAGDAALRKFELTVGDLRAALERWPRRPGASRARRAISFMDGRSESPGESRSRVRMRRAGLPAPELQAVIRSAAGDHLGRVDFLLRDHCIVGEFDGTAGYTGLPGPTDHLDAAQAGPTARDDVIRAAGHTVVRWRWPDLDRFETVAERFRSAMRAA